MSFNKCKFYIFIFPLFCAFTCGNLRAESVSEVETLFKDACINYRISLTDSPEELNRRKKILAKIRKISPNSVFGLFAEAYFITGTSWENIDDKSAKKGVDLYTKAIALKKDFAEAYFGRGCIYQKLDKPENAYKDFNSCVLFDDKFIRGYFKKAIMEDYYFNQYEIIPKTPESIIADCLKVIELKKSILKSREPDSDEKLELGGIWSTVVKQYLQKADFDFAEKKYNSAIVNYTNAIDKSIEAPISNGQMEIIKDGLSIVYYNRAVCYFNTGVYDKCSIDLKKAMEYHPDFYNECADLLKESEKYQSEIGSENTQNLTSTPIEIKSIKKKLHINIDGPVAVMDFDAKAISASDACTVSEFVRTDMVNVAKYDIVDRKNMEVILAEQNFQMTGCTDSECAVKIGKMLNVKYIVLGTVSKIGDMYYIIARIVDVSTGKILSSVEKNANNINDLRNASTMLVNEIAEK